MKFSNEYLLSYIVTLVLADTGATPTFPEPGALVETRWLREQRASAIVDQSPTSTWYSPDSGASGWNHSRALPFDLRAPISICKPRTMDIGREAIMAPEKGRRGGPESGKDEFDGRDLLIGRPEGAEGRTAAGTAGAAPATTSP